MLSKRIDKINHYTLEGLPMKLHKLLVTGVAVAAISLFAFGAYAEDAAPTATAQPAVTEEAAESTDAVAEEEEEEVELTYQQQASALIDTVIEDYTVRMAALQAIIDMRDDTIASDADTVKKLNNTIKLLTNVYKDAKKVDTTVRPLVTALPEENESKATTLAALDKLISDITKYEASL